MCGPYISMEDIAEKLEVSIGMAYILVRRGDIKSIRVGHLYRVPVSEFEAFLERGGSARKRKVSTDEQQQ